MVAREDDLSQVVGMFTVGVSDYCMVAHSLADPFFGPAQRLHGATYTVEVEVRSAALGAHNVVMDLGALRGILRQALSTVDYNNLDEHPAFPGFTSTSERLAEYLANAVAGAIAGLPQDVRPREPALLCMRLRETPNAWVGYEREIPQP
jgi:6-pyruvoyltetrahydropterin/6-carboxytetrahydropterin synthase